MTLTAAEPAPAATATAVPPAPAIPAPGARAAYIPEFDGLRAYLAWWVVGFHLYHRTGLAGWNVKPLALTLGQGWGAVPVFFILSGLVIALMGDARPESYRTFLVRRFFRLAPVYYLVLAVAAADAWATGAYGRSLWAHVALHATMLHGLVPDQVLPRSPVALEYVAWSISVEWQFYLVAPLVLRAVRGGPARALVLLVGVGLAGHALAKSGLSFAESSPVVSRAALFAVGIGSYAAFRFVRAHREACRWGVPYLPPLLLALVMTCGGPPVGPGPLWVAVFSAVLLHYAGVENPVTRPVRVLLAWPAAVGLGRLSYSTYLCHDRVLWLVDGALDRWPTPLAPAARGVALVAVGVPLILATAAALYHTVERPGIALGKRLAARLDGRA